VVPGTQGVAQRRSTVETGELASEDPAEGRALPADGLSGENPGEHTEASDLVTVTRLESGTVGLCRRLNCRTANLSADEPDA